MAKGQPKPNASSSASASGSKSTAAKTYGRYKVLSPLGQGAMASVFLAEDPALGRLVAIKVIHSHLAGQADLLTRFTSEAKTAAALRSPNIVEVFDYGFEGGAQYLVMEYIDGPTLQHVLNLQMGEPLSPVLAACMAVQAAEGLMVAERKSVVHRDIKPENLMLTSNGLLKIADFGIAHITEQNLTRTGSLLGSPSYMAPEQVDGGKPSHQTDMFALGAVFYACLTGRKPFNGPNIPSIFRAICELPHKPVEEMVPDLDPKLIELSSLLLNKKPEERGGGAKVLAGQLRQWLNQQGIYDPTDPVQALLATVQDKGDRTMVESGAPIVVPTSSPDQETPDDKAESAKSKSEKAKAEKAKAEKAKAEKAKSEKAKAAADAKGAAENVDKTSQGLPGLYSQWSAKLGPKWALPALGGAVVILVTLIVLLVSGGDKSGGDEAVPVGQAKLESEVIAQPKTSPPSSASTPEAVSVEAQTQKTDSALTSTSASPAQASTTVTKPVEATPVAKADTTLAATAAAMAAQPGSPTASQDSTELHITSAPPFAEVFIGTRFVGTTPLKRTVSASRHKLLINHRRFVSIDTVVRLKPGKVTLKFRFTEAKPQ
jgi:serine/threonine protein kinase